MTFPKASSETQVPSNGRRPETAATPLTPKAGDSLGALIAVAGDEQKLFLGLDPNHPSGVRILGFTRDAAELIEDVRSFRPQVVLISPNLRNYHPGVIHQIANWPASPIAVLGLVPARGDWGTEMAANGALGFYHLPITPGVVDKFLAEASQHVDRARELWRQPLVDTGAERTVIEAVRATAYQKGTIAFWSLKGGDGKTTLAVNTACLLSQVAGKQVLLVDADMNCGRVALHVGIPPDDRTLVHLASDNMIEGNRLDAKMLRRRTKPADSHLDRRTKVVESRLDVLFGITKVRQCTADELRGRQGYQFMEDLLKLARSLYDFVILDLGSNTELAPHKAALLNSDQVMFVNTSDRTSLLHNRETLDYLAGEHDVPVGKFKLVVNRYHANDRIDLAEVPKVMGMPIIAVVPEDLSRAMMASVNVGRPFVLDHMGKNSDSNVEATLAGLLDIAEDIFPPMSELIEARRGKARGWLGLFQRK